MKKTKYEKPMSLDAGAIASIQGAFCGHGSFATDGCTTGHDPNMQTVCKPTGAAASNNCQDGSSAQLACASGNKPGTGFSCNSGTSATLCSSGSSPQYGG